MRHVKVNGQAAVIVGDVLEALARLPDNRVQMVCTSPPYLGLRDYGLPPTKWPAVEYAPLPGLDVRVQVPAQTCCLGLETDPLHYIGHLVLVMRELHRVLHPLGTVWFNIGDSYARDPKKGQHKPGDSVKQAYVYDRGGGRASATVIGAGVKSKDLLMVPNRLALALQAAGWYVRSEIIWAKGESYNPERSGNARPESVTDRPAHTHEKVWLLSKSERYFFDHLAVKEAAEWARWGDQSIGKYLDSETSTGWMQPKSKEQLQAERRSRNLRNVWTVVDDEGDETIGDTWRINTKGYRGAHFAVMPEKLVEVPVLAGTSTHGCCPHCHAPWKPVYQRVTPDRQRPVQAQHHLPTDGQRPSAQRGNRLSDVGRFIHEWELVDWEPTCECSDNHPVPCLVLDPFSGSGTTGVVAQRHGRAYLGIEANADYVNLQIERLGRG